MPTRAAASAATPRANVSALQRTRLLLDVVRFAGGAVDDADVPRVTKAYLAEAPADASAATDFVDRQTRAKALRMAEARHWLGSVKLAAAADGQRPRTMLYDLALDAGARARALERAAATDAAAPSAPLRDVSAHEAGLGAEVGGRAPWSESSALVYGARDDPLADPQTPRQYARHPHVLRAYYGFAHGPGARLALFLEAAWDASADASLDLSAMLDALPLRTLLVLVPLSLRSPAVVRAATTQASLRVRDVPPTVARRLHLGRRRALLARLATYAAQLVALGVAKDEPSGTWRLAAAASPGADVPPLPLTTRAERAAFWHALRNHLAASAAPPRGARDVHALLRWPAAWRTSYELQGVHKALLQRYTRAGGVPPPPEAHAAVGAAIYARAPAITAFLARARGAPSAPSLSHKVETRRTQRAAAWDAAWAELAPAAGLAASDEAPRALAPLAKRYVHGRDAWDDAELRRRMAAALRMRPRRAAAPRARRGRASYPWTPTQQTELFEATVVLHERLTAWRAWLARHGRADASDDWSALAQLWDADAPASVAATWRARRKQLLASPAEHARLALAEKTWRAVAHDARRRGALRDPAWPHPTALDLRTHMAYFRRHVDVAALWEAHAQAAAAVSLPRTLRASDVALWAPLAPRRGAAWPSAAAPMVHRLHALKTRPWSVRALADDGAAAGGGATTSEAAAEAAAAADGSAPALADALPLGAVHMLVAAPLPPAALAAWSDAVGAAGLEAALAWLLERRVVRWADDVLVYTDEHQRALGAWPLAADAADARRDALQHQGARAHPAASDGASAAWISMLAAGDVRADVSLEPLQALRQRTRLNARTLDDAETECVVRLTCAAGAASTRPDVPRPPRTPPPSAPPSASVPTLDGARVLARPWHDAHGQLHDDVWLTYVRAVAHMVLQRPGASAAALAHAMGAGVEVAYVHDVLDALRAAGCVSDVVRDGADAAVVPTAQLVWVT